MKKNIQWVSIITFVLFSILFRGIDTFAMEKVSEKNTDCDVIKVLRTDSDDEMSLNEPYFFTEASAGKVVPLQIDMDGVMYYYFSSPRINLLDEKKKIIDGESDNDMMYNSATGTRAAMLPVKKDKQYYIQLPDMMIDTKYEVYVYIYPNPGKKLENGKVYMVEGKGKYVYYPFDIKRKSLAGLYVNAEIFENDKMYYKVQKKIHGKWKDITSVRTKMAYPGQYGEIAPYGLAKGAYRLGVKIEKDQIASIKVDIRRVKYKNYSKKSKAVQLGKGKSKEGIFTWEDKKSHWYKVTKSNKNKVKRITMYAGCAVDKIDFTIYKKGMSGPIKTVCMRGKDRIEGFVKYVSKSYTLRNNGTYFIKVSKANKKTNGAYKIKVK